VSYKPVTKQDWERTAIYISVGMLLIATAAIFLFAIDRIIGAILWLILVGVVLISLITWHTKTYAYRCKRCGEQFEISNIANFVSPQGVGKDGAWKYLKCPRCDTLERAEVLRKVMP